MNSTQIESNQEKDVLGVSSKELESIYDSFRTKTKQEYELIFNEPFPMAFPIREMLLKIIRNQK